MNNINIEKLSKWGFIVSLGFVGLAMLLRLGTIIRYLDAIAVVFGLLLAFITIFDLLGWYKVNTKKPVEETKTETKN